MKVIQNNYVAQSKINVTQFKNGEKKHFDDVIASGRSKGPPMVQIFLNFVQSFFGIFWYNHMLAPPGGFVPKTHLEQWWMRSQKR